MDGLIKGLNEVEQMLFDKEEAEQDDSDSNYGHKDVVRWCLGVFCTLWKLVTTKAARA